jgi:2-polyprenylphenol 6-hydroxylase
MSVQRHDIAVVGGGVVGLAAAWALRAAGFDAVVIEQGPTPVADPGDLRVYAVSPGSAAALPPALLDHGAIQPFDAMRVWHAEVTQSLNFSAADAGCDRLGWIAPESVLRAGLWAALPVTARREQTAVTDLTEHADGISLWLSGDHVVRCRLLLACDGAGSPLRAWAGIDTHAWSYSASGLVADVAAEAPHQRGCLQRFLPDSVVALLPRANGHYALVWSTPDAEALAALDASAFGTRLTEHLQDAVGPLQRVTDCRVFPLRAQHAERYVSGRVVLVGDAAHTVHPLAGQGVNLGLGDVQALVQVLVPVRDAGRDWTAPRVLARYQRARRAANAEMMVLTDLLSRGFAPVVPGLSDVLDQGMRWVNQITPVKAALIRRALAA